MQYADLTFRDKNPLKRWLQNRRLLTALSLTGRINEDSVLLDYGAGNGELCKHLVATYPKARIICYEPSPSLFAEAFRNIGHLPQIELFSDFQQIPHGCIDVLFCLEVFEHLPPAETQNAFQNIVALLKNNGRAIIGVPVEIGIPALYKGIFRMFRRYGAYDATPGNIIRSVVGCPPANRPVGELAGGLRYHYEHMGFDYRKTRTLMKNHLKIIHEITSPFAFCGPALNPEIYFIGTKQYAETQ